jgi:hypothetical protein
LRFLKVMKPACARRQQGAAGQGPGGAGRKGRAESE